MAVRIPSGDDIERRLPRAQMGVQRVGVDQTGATLASAGANIASWAAGRQDEEDRYDIARAKSYYLTERLKAERELDDDPDYMKWGDKYASRLSEIEKAAQGMIRNPRHQERFGLEIAGDKARAIDGVFGKQKGKWKEAQLADLMKLGDDNATTINDLIARGDEKGIHAALTAQADAYDAAARRGVIGADDAMKAKLAFRERYANLRAGWDLLNRPEAVLGYGGGSTSLIAAESGGKPDVVNEFGYAGLYQFGAPRLSALGVYKPGQGENLADWQKTPKDAAGKWSGTFNIPGHPNVRTLDDFRASPEAQQTVFALHTAKMDEEIKANGLDAYEGKTVSGVVITREGLRNMLHLGGVGSTKAALEGRGNPKDANGTSVMDYARMGAGGGFDANGAGYDYPTARAAGMGADGTGENAGHWGSVAPVTPDVRARYGLPENSYLILKGKAHPTFDKAVEAERARGSKVVQLGGRYYSVPADFTAPADGATGIAANANRPAYWAALSPEQQLRYQALAAAAVQKKIDAQRVEDEKRFVQDATQSLFDRFGTNESAAAAHIRANYSGENENKLITAYRDRAEEARRIDRQGKDDRTKQALEIVWGGGTISPALQAQLERDGSWETVGEEIRAQASGLQRGSNFLWLHENYWSLSPAERTKVPLATIKKYAGRNEYSKIVEERENAPGAESVSSEQTSSQLLARRIRELKLDPDKPNDNRKIDALHNEIEARYGEYEKKNGIKIPDHERRKIINELTGKTALDLHRESLPGVSGGASGLGAWVGDLLSGGSIETRLYELTIPGNENAARIASEAGVPVDDLPEILRALSAKGSDISIANIRKEFYRGVEP